MESLLPFTHWHWLTFALILGILELMLPGVVFLWLGISAAILGFILFIQPELALIFQISIFLVLSILSVVLARYLISKRNIETDHPQLNERSSQFIGEAYILNQRCKGAST